jgi:glycerol-3-phosphate acyltransferase PlsY
MIWELGLVAVAYLLGSLPSALLVVNLTTGKDIRREGSGNVGAANATRTGGLVAGAVVTIMDVLKGVLPVWAMSMLNPASPWIAAALVAAVVGHCYPIWLRFHGGKGVATAFGGYLFLSLTAALTAMGVWIVVLLVGRRVSLASLAATVSFPILLVFMDRPAAAVLGAVSAVSVLIVFRHRSNIRRLIDGTEPRISDREDA